MMSYQHTCSIIVVVFPGNDYAQVVLQTILGVTIIIENKQNDTPNMLIS